MNEIETIQRVSHRIGLMEFEREMLLRFDIHADHFKTSAGIADSRTASPAEQIK
jgi:hypothetical protein